MTGKSSQSAIKQAVYERNYRRARDRARTRLVAMYPDTYRELFEEERARDEAEGKTWIGIDIPSGTAIRRSSGVGDPATTNARAEQETDGNL